MHKLQAAAAVGQIRLARNLIDDGLIEAPPAQHLVGRREGIGHYLLVPLLFSEVVNLHPIAIIVAILVFGGLWGFWGVFFAIPLATLAAAALAEHHDIDVPYSFNRKEAKAHGEGGNVVGAPLQGRVLIVDDVITAGTAIRESFEIIDAAGAKPAGVVIALDRQERGQGALSAVQELKQSLDIPVISIVQLDDLINILEESSEYERYLEPVLAYRKQYGVIS